MIRGVLLPIITPFDEKIQVDEQIMRALVDFHIKAGVQGLFVLGSTGQGPAMTIEERKHAAAIALDQAKSRVPVVIHVGTADAQSTVELAEHAAAHKADAVAIVPPYYYSDHTEFEIVAHYKAVAKAVPLPIFIYENPKYSGISIPPGLAVRILGPITRERIALLQRADAIVSDEVKKAGWYRKLWQSFAVLLPVQSVGVMGDARTYENAVALRSVNSDDFMTADWSRLPH